MASAPNHMMDAAWAPCISSLPFFPSSSLFSPPSVFTSSISLFGNGMLSHPTTRSLLHHLSSLLGTNTIFTLTSYWARFFFHPFILLSLTPPRPHPLLLSPLALSSPLSSGAFCTLPLQSKRLGLSKANSQHRVP